MDYYEKVLRCLNQGRVRYLVVGGVAVNRMRRVPAGSVDVPLVSLEDLIKMKTESGRRHDLSDVRTLKRIRELLRAKKRT